MAHAPASIDRHLPRAVQIPGARRDHLARPVGRERTADDVPGNARHALVPPARTVTRTPFAWQQAGYIVEDDVPPPILPPTAPRSIRARDPRGEAISFPVLQAA